MNVLITNIGRRSYFVNYFLDLKKKFKKLNIHLADNTFFLAGMQSKKVYKHRIPKISEGENKYIIKILKIVKKKKIKLIIPVTNFDLNILSKNKEKLKKLNCQTLISDNQLIKNLIDKKKCYDLCVQKKILSPKVFSNLKDLRKSKKNIFVRKKRFGHAGEGFKIIRKIDNKIFKDKTYIVQNYIKGREIHIDILNDFDGNYVASCAKEKLSIKFGETQSAKTLINNKINLLAKEISKKLGHIGNLDCDAIIDKKNNVYFIDFNPRFGGGYPFTHLAGLNFIEATINLLIKKKNFKIKKTPRKILAAKGISIESLN